MNSENILGEWKGYYKYGKEYPWRLRFKRKSFSIIIQSQESTFSGISRDEITEKYFNAPAKIEGLLHEARLQFEKKYPARVDADEKGNTIINWDQPSATIHYEGFFQRKFFSKQYYFAGKWRIHTAFINEDGEVIDFSCGGTWKMEKVKKVESSL